MLSKWIFSLLSFLLVSSSFSVIAVRNSVFSIIGLIVCFMAASGVLLYLGCEFFAFLFLIIYVGAIAVLFVFVLMMVELKNVDTYPNFVHILVCAGIPFFSVIWFYPFFSFFFLQNPYTTIVLNSKFISLSNHFFDFYFEDDSTEILIIGQLLYTKYALHFLTSGLILTLAVISVGLLTIDYKKPFISIEELIVSRKI